LVAFRGLIQRCDEAHSQTRVFCSPLTWPRL